MTYMWYSIALHEENNKNSGGVHTCGTVSPYTRIIIIIVGEYTISINNMHVVQYRLTQG